MHTKGSIKAAATILFVFCLTLQTWPQSSLILHPQVFVSPTHAAQASRVSKAESRVESRVEQNSLGDYLRCLLEAQRKYDCPVSTQSSNLWPLPAWRSTSEQRQFSETTIGPFHCQVGKCRVRLGQNPTVPKAVHAQRQEGLVKRDREATGGYTWQLTLEQLEYQK